MTKTAQGTVDRIESAANITLNVSTGASQASDDEEAQVMTVPISRLDTTKEVEINEIRESSLKASGYSITSISYSGTMMFKGTRIAKSEGSGDNAVKITDLLYDANGVPTPVSITITHDLHDESEIYQHVLVTSESYEVRSEQETETAFDWVAMDRTSDQPNGE